MWVVVGVESKACPSLGLGWAVQLYILTGMTLVKHYNRLPTSIIFSNATCFIRAKNIIICCKAVDEDLVSFKISHLVFSFVFTSLLRKMNRSPGVKTF